MRKKQLVSLSVVLLFFYFFIFFFLFSLFLFSGVFRVEKENYFTAFYLQGFKKGSGIGTLHGRTVIEKRVPQGSRDGSGKCLPSGSRLLPSNKYIISF